MAVLTALQSDCKSCQDNILNVETGTIEVNNLVEVPGMSLSRFSEACN